MVLEYDYDLVSKGQHQICFIISVIEKFGNSRTHFAADKCRRSRIKEKHFFTVNAEIFARTFFRESSHMRSSVKIKPSGNGKITLSFIDIGKS